MAARVAIILATCLTGNKLFFKGGLTQRRFGNITRRRFGSILILIAGWQVRRVMTSLMMGGVTREAWWE